MLLLPYHLKQTNQFCSCRNRSLIRHSSNEAPKQAEHARQRRTLQSRPLQPQDHRQTYAPHKNSTQTRSRPLQSTQSQPPSHQNKALAKQLRKEVMRQSPSPTRKEATQPTSQTTKQNGKQPATQCTHSAQSPHYRPPPTSPTPVRQKNLLFRKQQ